MRKDKPKVHSEDNAIKNTDEYLEIEVVSPKSLQSTLTDLHKLQNDFYTKSRSLYQLQRELPNLEKSLENIDNNVKVDLQNFKKDVQKKYPDCAIPQVNEHGAVVVWHKPKEPKKEEVAK